MTRSLSNVRMFSAYFANGIAKAVTRRGYAAAAQGDTVVSKAVRPMEEMTWMPDPKTGYYRPGNRRDEIDAAELRDLMLKKKDLCTTAEPQ